MKNGIYATVVAMALGVSGAMAANSKTNTPEYIKGEVVVKLKNQGEGIASLQAHALYSALSEKHDVTISPLQTDDSIVVVKAQNENGVSALLDDVMANSEVEYAEPNFIYRTFGKEDPTKPVASNDPKLDLSWGILNIGQKDSKGQVGVAGADVGAAKAWNFSKGSEKMTVAVIDTGVDYKHEDLVGNIMINTLEIAGNGVDDDKNGFVDDVNGWNFQGKNNNPMDDNRHGTHCSGTIGAKGNNAIGTAGVNWDVKILPIKFLSAQGSGSLADAVESIKYATKMGVKIMSNSWGGGGFSQTMFDAIKASQAKGILFVAAAGNSTQNTDTTPSYPASYKVDNVMSVAALDNRDALASFSNYGKTTVHIAAPGVNILSTVPKDKGGYASFSGTSMACPHVAGAAALLWSFKPEMSYKDIKDRLMATVDPVEAAKSKTITGGRVNVYNAIANQVQNSN